MKQCNTSQPDLVDHNSLKQEDNDINNVDKEKYIILKREHYNEIMSIIDDLEKVKEEFENSKILGDYLKYHSTFVEWTGLENVRVIGEITDEKKGDVVLNEFLWKRISGKRNIMFIIKTNSNQVFGSFHSTLPLRKNSYVCSDDNMFVFSLVNPLEIPAFKLTPKKKNRHLLWVHKKLDGLLFVMYCWDILNEHSFLDSANIRGVGNDLANNYETTQKLI